jgi:hypothetical protein
VIMSRHKSISDRKIAANRENSKKSTGPKTDDGKSKSKSNALRHGFLSRGLALHRDAEVDEFRRLLRRLGRDRQPANFLEELLVDEAAALMWKLRESGAMVDQALLSRRKASRIAIEAFASRQEDFGGHGPTNAFDAEKLSRYSEGLDCETITLSSQRSAADPSDRENGQRQEGLSVKLTASLDTALRYQVMLRRQLRSVLDQLSKLQEQRAKGADEG